MYPNIGVGYLCRLFGKTRQGWYEQCDREEDRSLKWVMVLKLVREIRLSLPGVGVRKLLYMLEPALKEHEIKMGRDQLYDLLGHHGLLLRYRRRRPYTTNSNHLYRKYPNLIRDLILTGPEQLWVSDITYLRLIKGFCYLSMVTDAYSRKIVGYQVHPTLAGEGALRSLRMAINTRKRKQALIHHSDRGIQYCCSDYVQMIENFRIKISMTENGDPYENAIAERVNGILKGEFGLDKTFMSIEQAVQDTNQAVAAYNHKRPHASCNYLTPATAHEQNGILRKRWKPPKRQYQQNIQKNGMRKFNDIEILITQSSQQPAPGPDELSTFQHQHKYRKEDEFYNE